MKKTKRKRKRHSCCNSPQPLYYSSWKDEDGRCVNCGKPLKYGDKLLKRENYK